MLYPRCALLCLHPADHGDDDCTKAHAYAYVVPTCTKWLLPHRHCCAPSLLCTVTAVHRHCCAPSLLCTITTVHHHCCAPSLQCIVTTVHSHCCAPSLQCIVTAVHHHCCAPSLLCTVTAVHHHCCAPSYMLMGKVVLIMHHPPLLARHFQRPELSHPFPNHTPPFWDLILVLKS